MQVHTNVEAEQHTQALEKNKKRPKQKPNNKRWEVVSYLFVSSATMLKDFCGIVQEKTEHTLVRNGCLSQKAAGSEFKSEALFHFLFFCFIGST